MKVVGYIRVSTDEQAESGYSLAAQERAIRAYCETYGLELLGIESDEGLSAKNLKRPGVHRALDHGVGLVVWRLDRLTRSLRDLSVLLEGPFSTRALHSVQERLDTTTATGRLVVNMLGSVAQWEREVISERTKAGMAEARRQGVRLGRPRKTT